MNGNLEPLLLLGDLVIEHAESPYLSGLEPDEFICIIDFALSVKASKESAIFLVKREVFPERNDLFFELLVVEGSVVVKLHLLRLLL